MWHIMETNCSVYSCYYFYSSTFWNQEIRNGNLSNNVCHSGGANGNYLAFSKITPRLNSGKDHNVVSRLVTTAFLNLIMNEVTTLTTEVITTETITEETTTEFYSYYH